MKYPYCCKCLRYNVRLYCWNMFHIDEEEANEVHLFHARVYYLTNWAKREGYQSLIGTEIEFTSITWEDFKAPIIAYGWRDISLNSSLDRKHSTRQLNESESMKRTTRCQAWTSILHKWMFYKKVSQSWISLIKIRNTHNS